MYKGDLHFAYCQGYIHAANASSTEDNGGAVEWLGLVAHHIQAIAWV
jgi:hypothetical protein